MSTSLQGSLIRSQLRELHGNLLDIIESTTDHRRWDAIEQLRQYGFQNDQISLALDKHHKFVDKWKSRNKDKYSNRPEKRSRNTTKIEQEEDDYGSRPPTGYISNLNHEDWGVKYCDYNWRLPYLRDMDQKIWDQDKILVKVGRDHGKTWEMIKLFARWLLEKKTKVICIATPAKLDEIHQAVLTILESDEVREDYGDVIIRSGIRVGIWFTPDRLYETDPGKIVRSYRTNPSGTRMVGPNFQVQPAEGSITGLHCDEGWMHLEDPVQDVKVSTDAEKRRWRWLKRTVRYIKGLNTKFTGNGTSKDIGDFYYKMEKEAHFPVFTIPTLEIISGRLPTQEEVKDTTDHDRELVTSWPQVGTYRISECPNYPIERVLYEFIYHPEDAHAELNNDPLPMQGFEFDINDWIEMDPLSEKEFRQTQKFIIVDPSFGKTGSETAVLVIESYYNNFHLVDGYIGHLGSTAFINKILEFNEDIPNLLETWLEDNFNQVSRSLSAYNPITDLPGLRLFSTPPGTTKRARISLLGGVFASRVFKIYKTFKFKDKLKQEYLTFTSDLSDSEIRTKFNALDCLSLAYQKKHKLLRNPTRFNTNSRYSPKARSAKSHARRMFG